MKNHWLYLLLLLADAALAELPGRFDSDRDLFLPQFDSKTDVDDLHSIAAVATLLAAPELDDIEYHAVAGAYGLQEGLYVPAPALFQAAFGAHWSDAHGDRAEALDEVERLAASTLLRGGSVWVAEAGQSDFSADWLERLHRAGLDTKRVHVVQHSDWNESVTTPASLARVRELASYHRIADGNAGGNGTPNFRTANPASWQGALTHPATGGAWRIAREIGNRDNGREGRYLNESIQAGGLDFSDAVESCWIFGCDALADVEAFFTRLAAAP
jgi:hypothetical protein